MVTAIASTIAAIDSDQRAPAITRVSTSRPTSSVPIGCSSDGACSTASKFSESATSSG